MTWIANMDGHPSEPEVFTFSQTSTRLGVTIRTKSYVEFDSRWPWWKKRLARLIGRTHRLLNSEDIHPKGSA